MKTAEYVEEEIAAPPGEVVRVAQERPDVVSCGFKINAVQFFLQQSVNIVLGQLRSLGPVAGLPCAHFQVAEVVFGVSPGIPCQIVLVAPLDAGAPGTEQDGMEFPGEQVGECARSDDERLRPVQRNSFRRKSGWGLYVDLDLDL